MPVTYENIVKCDLNGFDTLVGQITNKSTSLHAMLPNFPQDKYPEQYDELIDRLKILREIIGSEIDKIKLGVAPEFPKEWIERVNISEDDDDIVKAEKYKHNSLVINKKAYFMVYIYDKLMRSYKNHLKKYDLDCKNKYGVSYLDLKYSKHKTNGQKKFIKRCEYFSPVLDTTCIMNKLCHKIERLEKSIIYSGEYDMSYLPCLNKKEFEIDEHLLEDLGIIYKQYKAQMQFKYIKPLLEESVSYDDFGKYVASMVDALNQEYSEKCLNLTTNGQELFEYLLALGEKYKDKGKTFDYSFVWNMMGDSILDIIPQNSKVCVRDENGVEYLGNTYSMVGVTKNNDNLE